MSFGLPMSAVPGGCGRLAAAYAEGRTWVMGTGRRVLFEDERRDGTM